jgi:hypothetical protein
MKFRKIALPLLMVTLGAGLAYAKKEPKYEQMHQLTPEQSALVDKAVGREKIIIKNIQQRTPLVETYIQEMKPDEKLWQVPTGDTYMLNRVDFRNPRKLPRPEQQIPAGPRLKRARRLPHPSNRTRPTRNPRRITARTTRSGRRQPMQPTPQTRRPRPRLKRNPPLLPLPLSIITPSTNRQQELRVLLLSSRRPHHLSSLWSNNRLILASRLSMT